VSVEGGIRLRGLQERERKKERVGKSE